MLEEDQTADKGTDHEKVKKPLAQRRKSEDELLGFSAYFDIFSFKTNLGSQYLVQFSPRFVSSALFLSTLPA